MSSEIAPCNLQRMTHRTTLVSLGVLLLCTPTHAVCSSDSFGPTCQYRCRCNRLQCDSKGTCHLNSVCHIGYFGPSCQYINAAVEYTTTPGWLYDNNDTTCNPNTSPGDVTVNFHKPAAMTWLRVHVRNPQSIDDASTAIMIKLNGTEACVGRRVYLLPPGILDVSCDNVLVTSSIIISGSITPHICNVYISGGRNVAHLQNNTVIGSRGNVSTTDPVDENLVCMTEQSRMPASEINIAFDKSRLLYRIMLVVPPDMLSNNTLSIKMYLESVMAGSPINVVVDKEIVNIFISDPKPANRITVAAAPEIEFCEVETFGETWCEGTHYGFDCENRCQCAGSEVCFPATGMCAPKCPSGKYGTLCTLNCSTGCANNTCDYQTGKCACKPGFQDVTVCEQGCKAGYFGPNCTLKCQDGCLNSTCNITTGGCLQCKPSRFGLRNCSSPGCSGFVLVCDRTCSEGCLNKLCNQTTGLCFTCASGFQGRRCIASEDYIYLLWLILLAVPLLPVSIIAAYFLARKKQPTSPEEEVVKAEDNKSLKSSAAKAWTFSAADISAEQGQDASSESREDISVVGSQVD